MKAAMNMIVLLALTVVPMASAAEMSPIGKVLQLISDLQAKIVGEGEKAQKVYDEFAEWCEDRSKELMFEIKTGKAEVADLKATIAQETSNIATLTARLEDLSGELAKDEADLKAATHIRDQENQVFSAEETELSDVIDTLQRAILILEREMRKGGASMMQLKNAANVAEALRIMVDASMFASKDAATLTALVQDSDDSEAPGAPAASVYKSQSGNIVQTLQDLLEKAEGQLDAARKKEMTSKNNFDLLKQSLQDEIKFGNNDMSKTKKAMAASSEKKAIANGDLEATSKEFSTDVSTLGDLHHNCMTKAEDFEAETKSRAEELNTLAQAKKIIKDTSGGAEENAYGFLQVARSQLRSGADLAQFEAVRFVRDLAKKQHSIGLAQLASRMSNVVANHGSDDPFAKVKGLIADMIEKLESEQEADAKKEAWCDKEMAESQEKKADKTAEIEKLSTKIDQDSSRSEQLKEQIAALERGLSKLATSQAEMSRVREAEHAVFVQDSAETEQGLNGVKAALKVLREYYAKADKAHNAADGAGEGIIGLLEVCESDFSKGLAEMNSNEASAAAAYDKETKENEVDRTTKEQDVKYKSQESTSLDKAVAEDTSDRSEVQAELDSINEYIARLKDQCTVIDKSVGSNVYAERKARRDAEIAGLQQALQILEGETALIQRKSRVSVRKVTL